LAAEQQTSAASRWKLASDLRRPNTLRAGPLQSIHFFALKSLKKWPKSEQCKGQTSGPFFQFILAAKKRPKSGRKMVEI